MMENTLCSDYKDQRHGREDIVIENALFGIEELAAGELLLTK